MNAAQRTRHTTGTLALLVVILLALQAAATLHDLIPSNLSGSPDFSLHGVAVDHGMTVDLTPSSASVVGGVWSLNTYSLLNMVDVDVSFQMSEHSRYCQITDIAEGTAHRQFDDCEPHSNGGDGIALVFQASSVALRSLGGSGGGGGFDGLTRALAVYFDSHSNMNNHETWGGELGVYAGGASGVTTDVATRIYSGALRFNMSDTMSHSFRASLRPGLPPSWLTSRMQLNTLGGTYLDSPLTTADRYTSLYIWMSPNTDEYPEIVLPINLDAIFGPAVTSVYAGLTSSTGGRHSKHTIVSWEICERPTPVDTLVMSCPP